MSNTRLTLIEKQVKCSCKGYNLDKLLQPNILILLAKQDLHGYLIIQQLEDKNLFQGEKADNTGVYRTLKLMEDKELVKSRWDLEGSGTAKKVYSITEEGSNCLHHWIDTLQIYRNTVDQIITEAKEIIRITE